jgi:hypothetical protein
LTDSRDVLILIGPGIRCSFWNKRRPIFFRTGLRNAPDLMPYKLIRLAPGSYDVFLDGVVVASLVRSPERPFIWSAELLLDLPITQRPRPFQRTEHQFDSFEDARTWLGDPEVDESESAVR